MILLSTQRFSILTDPVTQNSTIPAPTAEEPNRRVMTLHAKWVADQSYRVDYYFPDGSLDSGGNAMDGGPIPGVSGKEYAENGSVDPAPEPAVPANAGAGRAFVGWSTMPQRILPGPDDADYDEDEVRAVLMESLSGLITERFVLTQELVNPDLNGNTTLKLYAVYATDQELKEAKEKKDPGPVVILLNSGQIPPDIHFDNNGYAAPDAGEELARLQVPQVNGSVTLPTGTGLAQEKPGLAVPGWQIVGWSDNREPGTAGAQLFAPGEEVGVSPSSVYQPAKEYPGLSGLGTTLSVSPLGTVCIT